MQAFILHFLPASIPAFASLRLFPWISGALVDRNVDLCGKRRAGWRALSLICESGELCPLGEARGMLMEQRQQAMWTVVRPTDPPAALLWAGVGGEEVLKNVQGPACLLVFSAKTENHYPPRHKLDPNPASYLFVYALFLQSICFLHLLSGKTRSLRPCSRETSQAESRLPLNCL